MSKRENELNKQKNQNRLSAAKDNPETDIYENPIEKAAEMVNEDTANEDPANEDPANEDPANEDPA